MRKELQKQLFTKYPGIFRQAHLSHQESCMARLFECGDGWYSLIDTLCSTIQFRLDNPSYVNITPWYKKSFNWVIIKINNGLFNVAREIDHKNKGKWCLTMEDVAKQPKLTKLLGKIAESIPRFKDEYVKPEKIQLEAIQVKSKFGSLCFYADNVNDESRGMISLAESLSSRVCEDCGKFDSTVGKTSGWIFTICEQCFKTNPHYKGRKWKPLSENY